MEHGEIYMIHELTSVSEPWHKCVRVSGIVQSVDIHSKQCYLFHKGHRLRIDTTLVDQAILREDSLCQIIGEIRPSSEQVCTTLPCCLLIELLFIVYNYITQFLCIFHVLMSIYISYMISLQTSDSSDPLRGMYVEASIARSVGGLDLDLFEQALLQRRKFLQVTRVYNDLIFYMLNIHNLSFCFITCFLTPTSYLLYM